ncbi:MAG: zinc-ribbon domain-containing protein, partial [Abditibacteriota bacterium]|nr:zinc-ribbon domain-containing protein [Abditibacteriota bacterium]
MKYCRQCGKELLDEAVICPHCGCATGHRVASDEK